MPTDKTPVEFSPEPIAIIDEMLRNETNKLIVQIIEMKKGDRRWMSTQIVDKFKLPDGRWQFSKRNFLVRTNELEWLAVALKHSLDKLEEIKNDKSTIASKLDKIAKDNQTEEF